MSEPTANQVLLRGVLVADPDLRTTQTFGPVCSLRIRCPGAHPPLDEAQVAGCFNVLALGALANEIAQRVHARSRVTVEGWLVSTSWELADGRKQEAVSIIAEQLDTHDSEPEACEHCRQRRLAIRDAHAQAERRTGVAAGGDV